MKVDGTNGRKSMVSFIPKQMGIRRDILSMMGVRVETLFCGSVVLLLLCLLATHKVYRYIGAKYSSGKE